jgi:hypothetical protein
VSAKLVTARVMERAAVPSLVVFFQISTTVHGEGSHAAVVRLPWWEREKMGETNNLVFSTLYQESRSPYLPSINRRKPTKRYKEERLFYERQL